jgi:hypothetical protein
MDSAGFATVCMIAVSINFSRRSIYVTIVCPCRALPSKFRKDGHEHAIGTCKNINPVMQPEHEHVVVLGG